MKVKKLAYYISRFQDIDAADAVITRLEERSIDYLSIEDGLCEIYCSLVYFCDREIVIRIMHKFIKHEVKRGRLSHELGRAYIQKYCSSCIGCLGGQPNQLAHMIPGGCMYDPENGFY